MNKINLFGMPQIEEKKKTEKILKKISSPKKIIEGKTKISKSLSIKDKLNLINEEVLRILGRYRNDTQVLRTADDFHSYIDSCINNGIIAIDTETNNSLDPITCKIMGLCLFTPGFKNTYIPINHTDLEGNRLQDQLTEQIINQELSRLINNSPIILMHNGKFDYEVIKCTCNIKVPISWDTMIAAKVLDENEYSTGLKQQYIEKIDPSIEKYSIDHLFKDVQYAMVDPEIFALYAATDAFMTYKLYLYQKEKFDLEINKDPFNLFKQVEMPLVPVIAEMELAGMEVDQDYAQRLSKKYHNQLTEIDNQIEQELLSYKDLINSWRLSEDANYKELNSKPNKDGIYTQTKSLSEKLEDPINLASPVQLAILLYDILKIPSISKKSPRGTGEDILKAISEKYPKYKICNLILERREIVKLLSTYIDTIPELARRWPDGRVRTHFNQYGAATGRLSSSKPLNFQNIPSHNKEIRMLFKASKGYKIIGSDFSGQEPRLTAFYSQDENMINAYETNKDLYSVIASMSFDVPYEECLEFYPEGTEIEYEGNKIICGKKTHINVEGKTRRTLAKSILLGLLYGRGSASIGAQINKTREEAQEIINRFYSAFPKVKQWIDSTIEDARKNGYVVDIAGRHRRLPDITLPKYEFKSLEQTTQNFNPLLISKNYLKLDSNLINKYLTKLNNVRSLKELDNIKEEALKVDKLEIKDNSGFISQAERQAVNSRVQGGAATLTKCALIDLYNNEELNKLNVKIINAVHDEILIEAPEEFAEKASELLTSIMVNSAKKYVLNVPMSCDAYIVDCWYEDEFQAILRKEFKDFINKGFTEEQSLDKVINNNSQCTPEFIKESLKNI